MTLSPLSFFSRKPRCPPAKMPRELVFIKRTNHPNPKLVSVYTSLPHSPRPAVRPQGSPHISAGTWVPESHREPGFESPPWGGECLGRGVKEGFRAPQESSLETSRGASRRGLVAQKRRKRLAPAAEQGDGHRLAEQFWRRIPGGSAA